jgi:exopolysaccharide production protein ExoQ
MSLGSMRTVSLRQSAPIYDKCIIVPISVCAYCLIISPMLVFLSPGDSITSTRSENLIFWPAAAAIAVSCLAVRNRVRLTLPPHVMYLGAYLALAGMSTLWSFKPQVTIIKLGVQSMFLTSIILPAMLAVRTADLMRGVFLCFAFGVLLNVFLILCGYSTEAIINGEKQISYQGYLGGKNALGQFTALAALISVYEILHSGRRVLGFFIFSTSIYLVVLSHSKGSLAMAILAAILAKLTLFIGRKVRLSPAYVLLPLPLLYAGLSIIVGDLVNRISWHIYGNYNLSGRTDIWYFVNWEIARKPLFGWGYQSFWLSGPDAPSLTDAGGWIRNMPHAHNGYLDTIVDTGHVGLALFLVFIFATLHAVGRVANCDPTRAWLLLSIALFVILDNFIETAWMHGGDLVWVMFVIVVAEAGRQWQSSPPRGANPMRSTQFTEGGRPGIARRRGRFHRQGNSTTSPSR